MIIFETQLFRVWRHTKVYTASFTLIQMIRINSLTEPKLKNINTPKHFKCSKYELKFTLNRENYEKQIRLTDMSNSQLQTAQLLLLN